ncbi:MAG: single-stranded DNA-binding protein [Desulfofustis sp.]|nr:single-stranded DNA-binding protein [Desulfofustis sp.]
MINKAIIIGHLGADPEARFTQSGAPVTTFNVATSERWKDQQGNQQEATEWHRIVAWRNLADICGKYLQKGTKVYIEGKIQTQKWQDQQGVDRYTTQIVAREMKILSGGRQSDGQQQQGSGDSYGGYEPPPMGEDVPF